MTDLDTTPWRQLLEARTAEEFCLGWLDLQSRMIGGVSGGVVVFEAPETGSFAPVAFWPRGLKERETLAGVVERVIRERKGIVLRSEADREPDAAEDPRLHLAYPVWVGDRLSGVAALQITPRPQIQLQSAMRLLQWGVAWLQNWILRQAAEPDAHVRKRLTAALELAALVLEEEGFQAAATVFVTDLATRLRCDRVSIGFVRGGQVRVHALSHSAQFGKHMNLIRAIGLAMGESADQRAILRYPEPDEKSPHVLHFHELLARDHGDRAIGTVPFVDRSGRALGALSLERSVPEPFDRQTMKVCDSVAALVGPILEEKRKNDRPLIVKIGDSLWSQARKLVGPRHTVTKLVAAGLLGLAVFFCFATGQYRVTAPTTLEGEVQRAVVAPYRGFIFEAPVRAGDIVREGQVLCSLDERDLRLEQARLSGEREQYQVEHRKSMANGEIAAMKVLSKKMHQAEAQIALLDEQITRARIVAPFGGMVVSGDLSQSLGAPVEAGQILFEVAPLDSYRLKLKVDERDIGDVRAGQTGHLILAALTGTRLPFTVTKITPVSVSEEGRNFFVVEARPDQTSGRLRPGMEGFGKVEVARRRLIWIWTHDLIDWARLWAWSWLP